MDKNIAALLRNDTRTLRVSFTFTRYEQEKYERNGGPLSDNAKAVHPNTLYTYVTDLDLAVGDSIIVEAAGQLKIVRVAEIDDECNIQPNSDEFVRWVVAKVDFTAHNANQERNAEIEKTVSDAYRVNPHRSYAQQILSGVSEDDKDRLTKLLS